MNENLIVETTEEGLEKVAKFAPKKFVKGALIATGAVAFVGGVVVLIKKLANKVKANKAAKANDDTVETNEE